MVTIDINDYRNYQDKRIAILQSHKRRGMISAAKFMVLQLRTMSPHKSGRMIASIRRKGNSVSLGGTSKDKYRFPYVHWVNATPGMNMESVRIFGGMSRTYASTNHTGVPGFYWIAQERAREFGRDAMLTALKNTLNAEF